MVKELQFHEFSSIFPLLEGLEFDKLVEDIEKNGQHEAIVILDGKILDGRNRYLACQRLNKKPRLRELQCVDGDPLAFVWSANAERRHLTNGQLALSAAQMAALATKGHNQHEAKTEDAPNGAPTKIITINELRKKVGLPRRTLQKASIVKKHANEQQIQDIKTGLRALDSVYQEVKDKEPSDGTKNGPRFTPPKGETVEDVVRRGLKLEEDEGLSTIQAAKSVSMSTKAYMKFKQIVNLSDREDLSRAEERSVQLALSSMNSTGQTKCYNLVEDICNRIWGKNYRKDEKGESRRLEDFNISINAIYYPTTAAERIPIPQMPIERVNEVINLLKEGSNNIESLISRLRKTFNV